MTAVSTVISHYGYGGLGALIAIESMGVPVPGETALIAAAVTAATTKTLDIWLVIVAAATGAIMGDNVAYWIGQKLGFRLIKRYGQHVWLTERRIKLGQYLFLKYGGRIVFFGRFLPVLRELAALLAGTNDMRWRSFLIFNAAGGIAWTGLVGLTAFYLGKKASELTTPFEIGATVLLVLTMSVSFLVMRHQARKLADRAEEELPGPVKSLRFRRHKRT